MPRKPQEETPQSELTLQPTIADALRLKLQIAEFTSLPNEAVAHSPVPDRLAADAAREAAQAKLDGLRRRHADLRGELAQVDADLAALDSIEEMVDAADALKERNLKKRVRRLEQDITSTWSAAEAAQKDLEAATRSAHVELATELQMHIARDAEALKSQLRQFERYALAPRLAAHVDIVRRHHEVMVALSPNANWPVTPADSGFSFETRVDHANVWAAVGEALKKAGFDETFQKVRAAEEKQLAARLEAHPPPVTVATTDYVRDGNTVKRVRIESMLDIESPEAQA